VTRFPVPYAAGHAPLDGAPEQLTAYKSLGLWATSAASTLAGIGPSLVHSRLPCEPSETMDDGTAPQGA